MCSSNPEAVQTALFTGTLINRREGANAWQQPYGFQFLSLGAAILYSRLYMILPMLAVCRLSLAPLIPIS